MNAMPAKDDAQPGAGWPSGAEAWRVLFLRHPMPMWVYDIHTLQFLDVNDAAVAAYGYSAEEFLAMGLGDIRPEEDQARLLDYLRQPATGRGVGPEWRHRRRNGELIDVEVRSQPMDFAGHPARLVVAQDVTERKRRDARAASHARVMSLVASGAPLPDVLDALVLNVEALHPAMLCSVLLIDASGRRLRMGSAPSLPPFFNAAADGLPVGSGSACCGEAAFTGRRVVAEDIQLDPRWQPYRELASRAGLAACWSEPVRSRAGAVLGTFGVYHRETHVPSAAEIAAVGEMAQVAAIAIERRQADEALRQTQKLESLGTLAGGIAHDFNNILGAILGNVALARQDNGVSEAASSRLEQIQKSALRARLLVQQILAFSRRQTPQAVRQPLGPMVSEALELMRATLPAGVLLHTRLADRLPEVEADGTQVQQVLMNLCTNAWHAMAGAVGNIVVGAEDRHVDLVAAAALPGLRPGRCAHLWVRDDGSGMDEVTRARIFEPFFTTKPVGSGTGLGLAVVHGIVTEHHGAITVDTAPGQGTTFHVWLPVARSEALPALPPAAPATDSAQASSRHVLFVDDDAVMLLTGEGLLRSRGYAVTTADSGLAALAALRTAPATFDIVVTDHNMPDCSGLELARLLFAVRPGLPIIVCSGYIDAELQARATAAGVRAIVHKENVVEELAGSIERVLAAAR